MTTGNTIRAAAGGFLAFASMLAVYFSVLTLLSGWQFTASQFREFWPYVVPLAAGFGMQFGLFLYLKQATLQLHHAHHIVATSGATSTAAMLACCAHYLANVAPVLGAVGFVTVVAQYQRELFWVGLAFNAAGLVYVSHQVYQVRTALDAGNAC